jgi:hypothetical protein
VQNYNFSIKPQEGFAKKTIIFWSLQDSEKAYSSSVSWLSTSWRMSDKIFPL